MRGRTYLLLHRAENALNRLTIYTVTTTLNAASLILGDPRWFVEKHARNYFFKSVIVSSRKPQISTRGVIPARVILDIIGTSLTAQDCHFGMNPTIVIIQTRSEVGT